MSYRIALASSDGLHIDRHFGASDGFLIVEVTQDGTFLEVERRQVKAPCQHGYHDNGAMLEAVQALSDCRYVVAEAIGAIAVVTTATDVNGRFSVDAWAAARDMAISDMALAKRISAEILTRDIPICADRPLPEALPDGLVPGDSGALGICVSVRDIRPFAHTLRLVPRRLWVGIGCRRGIPEANIAAAVEQVFEQYNLCPEAVRGAASIDVKSDEAGLLAYCRDKGWPLRFYSADELERVRGSASGSEFVKKTVGVDNVCERSALAGGGRLIAPKTALNGVTVAVAEMEWGIEFG